MAGRCIIPARGPERAPLTLVGLNGLAGGGDQFWPLLDGVPDDVRVLLPDLPGCGGGDRCAGTHTVEAYTSLAGPLPGRARGGARRS